MSETNERRCEFTTRQSAELLVKGQKASLFYSKNMRTAVVLWVICAALFGFMVVMTLRAGRSLSAVQWTLIVMLLVLIAYRLWWVFKTLKTVEKRFQVAYPDGPYDVTWWIEGDRLCSASSHGENSVLLSSLRRLCFHRDVALLYTDAKMICVFPRDCRTDDQWREMCSCIRAANAKFRDPFR